MTTFERRCRILTLWMRMNHIRVFAEETAPDRVSWNRTERYTGRYTRDAYRTCLHNRAFYQCADDVYEAFVAENPEYQGQNLTIIYRIHGNDSHVEVRNRRGSIDDFCFAFNVTRTHTQRLI